MGKTRPPERNKLAKRNKTIANGQSSSPQQLLAEAASLLAISEPEEALKLGHKALKLLRKRPDSEDCLPALNLLGEVSVGLGDIDAARAYFLEAAEIDTDEELSDSQGDGPEKFFWLAQLSEEGGFDSVKWYGKGADVLRRQIASSLAQSDDGDLEQTIQEKRVKLANALCAIAEVYMTDLSWDDAEAEEQCNKVIEEALTVAPDQPETLQTAASVRISQIRKDEARQYLQTSLSLWKDLDPQDPQIPDYAVRISLSRLLMEAEMENDAIEVLERMVAEDDHSIEAWYLGGWCLYLIAQKEQNQAGVDGEPTETTLELLRRARSWLLKSLGLYNALAYEDERLRDHAVELVKGLNKILGEPDVADGEATADEDDWEEAEDSDDENMNVNGS